MSASAQNRHRQPGWSAALLHARAARLHVDAAEYFRSIGRPARAALEQTLARSEWDGAAQQLASRRDGHRSRTARRTIRTRRHGPSARQEPWAHHAGVRADFCDIVVAIGHLGVIVVRIDGELDETTIPALGDLLATLQRDRLPFQLDCSTVSFASSGLVECLQRNRAVPRVCAASAPVRRLFDLTGTSVDTDDSKDAVVHGNRHRV